jgi:hypothetical protein
MGESFGTIRLKKRVARLERDMSHTGSFVGTHRANYSNSTIDILALTITSRTRMPILTSLSIAISELPHRRSLLIDNMVENNHQKIGPWSCQWII